LEGQNFEPLSITFETFAENLAKSKIVARVNVKKIKAKNIRKVFTLPAMKRR
jgi:hypothetical protein